MPDIDRTHLAHSVRYTVHGLPDLPNQYGPGILRPSEVTLTYWSAPDAQRSRVHAYVAGRIWVDGTELPLLPGGLYGQHYDDGLDGWPDCLTEEARLHDPEHPSAPAPATDQPAQAENRLSVQHADALWDAVAVPGPRTPTFTVQHERVCKAVADILYEMRPAAEEPAAETVHCVRYDPHPAHLHSAIRREVVVHGRCPGEPAVVSAPVPPTDQTALRDRIARALARVTVGHGAFITVDVKAEYPRADAVLAALPAPADRAAVLLGAAEHLLARCPHLGKAGALRKCTCPAAEELLRLASQEPGGPDYATAREETLHRVAAEARGAQQDEATPCAPAPDQCGDEPCANHERAQSHAEGDHDLCEPDCGQPAQHAPGTAILCADCRGKGHAVCMADEVQR